MQPGRDEVKECPGCRTEVRRATLMSGNTIGAVWWTDGKMFAPMLPESPVIARCRACRSLFWVNRARTARSLGWEDEDRRQKETIPALSPPRAEDLHEAIASGLAATEEEEIALRTRAWWADNDPLRMEGARSRALSAVGARNLERLFALLIALDPRERLLKAEIARELGWFERALELLFEDGDAPLSVPGPQIRELAAKQVSVVRPVVLPTTGAQREEEPGSLDELLRPFRGATATRAERHKAWRDACFSLKLADQARLFGDFETALRNLDRVVSEDAAPLRARLIARIDAGDRRPFEPGVWDEPPPGEALLPGAPEFCAEAAGCIGADPSRASVHLARALELRPGYLPALKMRGFARLRVEDAAGAIEDLDAVIRAEPRSAAAYYLRSLARGKLGDGEGAATDLETASRVAPLVTEIHAACAALLVRLARFEAAEAALRRAIALDARTVGPWWPEGQARYRGHFELLGAIFEATGRPAAARRAAALVQRLRRSSP